MPKPAAATAKPIDIEPMLSIRDIARIVGCGRRTVATWRAEGYLCKPDLAHGKTVRWKRQTVEAWLAEQSAQAR